MLTKPFFFFCFFFFFYVGAATARETGRDRERSVRGLYQLQPLRPSARWYAARARSVTVIVSERAPPPSAGCSEIREATQIPGSSMRPPEWRDRDRVLPDTPETRLKVKIDRVLVVIGGRELPDRSLPTCRAKLTAKLTHGSLR